jgi:hypothetical protein
MPDLRSLLAARRVMEVHSARLILEMIDRGEIPVYVTWEQQWDAARDATMLLIRAVQRQETTTHA